MTFNPAETFEQWKVRKRAQAAALISAMPDFELLNGGEDFGTRFILADRKHDIRIIIGQVARADKGQPHIDLDDAAFIKAVIAAKGTIGAVA